MGLISRLCQVIAGVLFLASSIHASVIVVSYSSPYSVQNVGSGLDIPLSFQQFDPSLGTLESVGLEDSFTLTAIAFTSGFWLFDNCVPNTELSMSPNTATFTGIAGASKSVQADADVSVYTDAASCTNATALTASSTSSFDVTSLLTGGAMSGYIGLSQIGLTPHLDPGVYQGSVSGASTVTYTYDTAVPEPETFFVAGVGFAILAWARRRRVRIRRTS